MQMTQPASDVKHNRLQPDSSMIWIRGGTFRMGSDWHYPEEAPSHDVTVDGFWIDKYAVTNEQFAHFVEATSYVTLAERPPKPERIIPVPSWSCSCRPRLCSVSLPDVWISAIISTGGLMFLVPTGVIPRVRTARFKISYQQPA
jgi:formylglycine-generating enzyme required for sulfatase activity